MNAFHRSVFAAKAANSGGIVRRNVKTVRKYGGIKALRREVKRRGYHLIRTGGQYVIVCNSGHVKVLC